MATHSSIFAQTTPWTEESGGLQPTGSQRDEHDSALTNHKRYKHRINHFLFGHTLQPRGSQFSDQKLNLSPLTGSAESKLGNQGSQRDEHDSTRTNHKRYKHRINHFLFGHTLQPMGSQFSDQKSNLSPLHWKCRI